MVYGLYPNKAVLFKNNKTDWSLKGLQVQQ